jgi:ribosomal protein L37AE/L43A
MSTSYSGEKIIQRQRVCPKCKSFVTHEKISEKQFACPLCGNRVDGPPVRVRRIDAAELAKIIAAQLASKKDDAET